MRATHASSIHVADRSEGVGQVSADRMRGPRVPEAVRIESIQHSGHGAAAAQSNSVVGEFFLFLVMGMSGWWTVNALFWAEIPLEVAKTPEKKAISSILNLACQAGNVVPFLYKAVFSKEQQRRILPYSIIACQLTAVVVAVVAACFWEETTHNHSVVLIACTVMAGAVGTLSNVTYWPLCVRYSGTHCTKGMSVGTTAGGLVLVLFAWVQGVGNTSPQHQPAPLFSFQAYMLGVAATQVLFALCFVWVLRQPTAPEQLPIPSSPTQGRVTRTPSKAALMVDKASSLQGGQAAGDASDGGSMKQPLLAKAGEGDAAAVGGGEDISKVEQRCILAAICVIYGLTYSLPSVAPYMIDSYGANVTLPGPKIYMLITIGTQAGDVAGRASTLVPWVPGSALLWLMTGLVVAISGLLVCAGVWSKHMPSILPGWFGLFYPTMFFLYYFIRGYVVTILYVRVKVAMPKKQAEAFSSNMGLCGQIGAAAGCASFYIVINWLKWFPTGL